MGTKVLQYVPGKMSSLVAPPRGVSLRLRARECDGLATLVPGLSAGHRGGWLDGRAAGHRSGGDGGARPSSDWFNSSMEAESHAITVDDLLTELGSDPSAGISRESALARLTNDGPNELQSKKPVPLWRKILDQFREPLVLLLVVAIAVSLAAWVLEGADGVPVDAIVIAVVICLNSVLGLVQEGKAAQAVAALSALAQSEASVIRGGQRMQIPARELVAGDLVILAEGDQISADARLLAAEGLRVIESSLTGESEAVHKSPGELAAATELADRTNMVFRGTSVAQGSARAVVTATGTRTEMGRIATLLDLVEDAPTPLQREIATVSKMLGTAVVIIAVVVVAILLLVGGAETVDQIISALLLGVSLAVAAVPEGLPAILSVVLAMGVRGMAERNAVVKKLTSVETLGSATVICSDKTGTLTRSEMTIQEVVTCSGAAVVTGVGYQPVGELSPDADRDHLPDDAQLSGPLRDEVTVVLSGGALASDAELARDAEGEWHVLGDPTEGSFFVAERKLGTHGGREGRFVRMGAVPFTSERKLMSVIHLDQARDQVVLFAKGAPDILLGLCTRVRRGGQPVELDEDLRVHLLDEVETMSSRALRTLAVAYRPLSDTEAGVFRGLNGSSHDASEDDLEHDLILAGIVGIIDPPREEAAVAVAEAHRAGIRVMMITGDHPATAGRIAADLGIAVPGARVMTGAELAELDEEQLAVEVQTVNVYARVAPAHKMSIVRALQSHGEIVSMTGDGVNDAPALRAADIGVAMGVAGTQVTKEAGTMVLADDNFATIVDAIREGRRIFDNIRKFLRYLLSSNMGEVITVFAGVVLGGHLGLRGDGGEMILPLVATQILWINLITDSAPALAMGVDPATGDLMGWRPRRISEPIIDRAMWQGVVLIGLVMAAVTLLTMDVFLPGGLVEGHDSLAVARTAGFTTLVLAQLFNTVNSRSEERSAFEHLFVNRWLWGALGLAVVLQFAVVEVPVLQQAFSTASLDAVHWAVCFGLASVVLWFDEVRKVVRRAFVHKEG